MSESENVNELRWWEDYFASDGGWEQNGGRAQSRIFAEQFTARMNLRSSDAFSLLDVGCALGDAIRHFAAKYPKADLTGVDFSATAIARCKRDLGHLARFAVSEIDLVGGTYDIMYCSNTLEHFADYDAKARILSRAAKRLCILVPYEERLDGKPLKPSASDHHQHTFGLDSFQFLVREGLARSITTHVFSCPGAWGWSSGTRRMQRAKNVLRFVLGRSLRSEPFQILYDIVT